MSFWATSQGEVIDAEKNFDGGGGEIEVLPNDIKVLAMIEDVKWDKTGDDMPKEFINARWTVLKPDDYKNRKVFQKLWVTDLDPRAKDKEKAIAKRDKAKHMLAAIDANCGGKLRENDGKPSDSQLMAALSSKPMQIHVMVAEFQKTDGSTGKSNWVRAVAAKGTDEIPDKAPPVKESQKSSAGSRGNIGTGFTRDMDDDIPF